MSSEQIGKIVNFVVILLAAVLLFMAQSAYWVNHSIFDKSNFTETVSSALMVESSRNALAESITNRILEDKPLLNQYAGNRITSVTSGLLSSDLSAQIITSVSDKVYSYVTAPNRGDVDINLTSIKTPLSGLAQLSQNENVSTRAALAADKIPDRVVVVESDDFPDLSETVSVMLWLAPVFWFGTVGLFALYIYINRTNIDKSIYIVGFVILAVAIFGMISLPFIPPPIANAIPDIRLRPVAENMAQGFLKPFRVQMVYMAGFSTVFIILFSLRKNIAGLAGRATEKLKSGES